MVESRDLVTSTHEHTYPDLISTRPDLLRSVILAISFWIWIALLCFPLITMSWFEIDGNQFFQPSENQMLIYQVTGLLQFVIVATCVFPDRMAGVLLRYTHFQAAIVVIIVLSLALQFHGPDKKIAEGLIYTLILLTVIACLSVLWTMRMDILVICLGGATVVTVAFGLCALAYLGWPEGRNIGGIHPNSFGAVMLAGFIFSQFSRGFVLAILRVACLVLAAVVSSRFAVIGCVLSFLVFETTYRPFSTRLVLFAFAGIACLIMFPQALMALLALDDPSRNLDSGFTGRDDQWNMALAAISDAPFGLGFKRPLAEEAGHNGYLRLLTEFGLIGGGLIIFATICTVIIAVIEAALCSEDEDGLRRMASARAGGLVALAFASFFQPQILNLGDIHGISVMLVLFAPSFGGRIRLTIPRRIFRP